MGECLECPAGSATGVSGKEAGVMSGWRDCDVMGEVVGGVMGSETKKHFGPDVLLSLTRSPLFTSTLY